MPHQADPESQSTLVLIVDDDDSLRRALARQVTLLGYQVECFAAPEELLAQTHETAAACMIVDLVMPGMSGLELQTELERRGCMVPQVFLSGRGDIPSTVQAMQSGAIDFLEKPVEASKLAHAIERAVAYYHSRVEEQDRRQEMLGRFEKLTVRERTVFEEMVAGHPNKVIAYNMGISIRTVKAHRHQVMRKFGAGSLADLAFIAHDIGVAPKIDCHPSEM